MASNSFGNLFKITTWGESHGKAIGVVIDGCPAGIPLDINEINEALLKRAPGHNKLTSPRKEKDIAEILSGTFQGETTGAPIMIMIQNTDADTTKYEPIKDLLRPGHANYTYLEKYGIFDYRGGGRASARETASRVAAGAVAKKILSMHGIELFSFIKQIGTHLATIDLKNISQNLSQSKIYCPDFEAEKLMTSDLEKAKEEGDSLGGIVECIAMNTPAGLGDPIYEKLEAKLAHAMMSIPASKGFEIGTGFNCASMKGSTHNDTFTESNGKIETRSNHAGGILGGISNGMPIVLRVAFKPTSSIRLAQNTLTTEGKAAEFILPQGSRHDPCVAIRAVPVVEAMTAIVLVDALLLNRVAKL